MIHIQGLLFGISMNIEVTWLLSVLRSLPVNNSELVATCLKFSPMETLKIATLCDSNRCTPTSTFLSPIEVVVGFESVSPSAVRLSARRWERPPRSVLELECNLLIHRIVKFHDDRFHIRGVWTIILPWDM